MSRLNSGIRDWSGKRAWVIGASSGIGAEIARQLHDAGALVALSARRKAKLDEVANPGDRVLAVDVTDQHALTSACQLLHEEWGGIDIVFYCAGVYTPMHSWEMDLEGVRDALAINLEGVYNLLHAILPRYLENRSGALCIVASAAGYTGLPKAIAYGPSKAAIINLAQILYTDLSPLGIAVYLVNPGFVATRLTAQNDFKMPALISTREAATEILGGIGKGLFEIHFPKRFTRWMKLLSRLPNRLRFYLIRRAVAP